MTDLQKYALMAALGVGAVAALAYFAKQGVKAVGQGAQAVGKVAATKLNPYSGSNVLYDNVIGGAGRAVSGDSGWTLGGWLYDVIN